MKPTESKGFTLLEVVVVLAVAMLAVTSMLTVFDAQNKASVRTENQNDLNGAVNTSFNLVGRHLRMSGFRVSVNAAVNPVNNYGITGGTQSSAFNGGAQLKTPLLATTEMKPGTDAYMVLSTDNRCLNTNLADNGTLFTNVASGSTATARICQPNCFTVADISTTPLSEPYIVGDKLLVVGDDGAIFVKVTAIQLNQTTSGVCSGAQYTNVTYKGIDELNLSIRNLAGGGNPGVDQLAFRLEQAHLYYVDASNRLKRLPIDETFSPEIISEGVEDMQLRYDVKDACTTTYWCAACKSCDAPATYPTIVPPTDTDNPLSEIRAVRVGMVIRNFKEDRASFLGQGIAASLFDHPVTSPPADNYRRRIVTELVRVKNLEMQDL